MSSVIFILLITVSFAIVLFIFRVFTTEEFPRIPGVKWLAWFIAWFFTLVVSALVLALLSALLFGRPTILVNIFGLPSISEAENIIEQPESTIEEVRPSPVDDIESSFDIEPPESSPAVQDCLDNINQQTLDLESLKVRARECLSLN